MRKGTLVNTPNSAIIHDMGSPDFRETFLHVARQLAQYKLAYLHIVDGLGFGFHGYGKQMTLADFRAEFDGPLIGNCGYTQETAEAAIQSYHADMISFGRPIICNPDLVERFANGWPLNTQADMKAGILSMRPVIPTFQDMKNDFRSRRLE